MNPPINFLPWRQQRRTAFLRFWLLMFVAPLLLPFSPLDFQLPGAQLVFWHPSAQGGELALKTLWEAVPSAFTRLAERNVSVSRFSLSVEGDDLLFTLQLETPHEG